MGRAPAEGMPQPCGWAPARAGLPPGLTALCKASRGRPGLGAMGRKRDFMLPVSRGWPHSHALTGQCWRRFCFMVELAPETAVPKQPRAHPAPQGSCPFLPFPLPHPVSRRPQSLLLFNKQPPTRLPYLPRPQTNPCWGDALLKSSSLRLV